jgi:hypothetical protein
MKEFDDEVMHCFSTCDPNGNLEVKVRFLKAKQGYTPRKIEKDKWNTVYYKSRYEIQEQTVPAYTGPFRALVSSLCKSKS